MQQVTLNIGNAFLLVEKSLRDALITSLLQVLEEETQGRRFIRLPVNQAGLALPDPTKMTPENWTVSCVITGHLVEGLRGQEDLQTADHYACLKEGRMAVQKRVVLQAEESQGDTLAGASIKGALLLHWLNKTGACLTLQLSPSRI